MKLILGKKGAMTQFFDASGKVQPVTEISVTPNVVTFIKTKEKDGYDALQLGSGEKKHASKSLRGHLKDLPSLREGFSFWRIKEIRTDVSGISRGYVVALESFAVGELVDVIGWSKGRGYTGVVKRHGFHGHPTTHGHKDQERMPGSIGAGGVQHVFKGKRMAGHMGDERSTVKNLEIVRIDSETQKVYVKGGVPGSMNSFVMLRSAGSLSFVKPAVPEAPETVSTEAIVTPEEAIVLETTV